MLPKCEFGDCNNDVGLKQRFDKIEFGICLEHREAVFEAIENYSEEWSKARKKIILKLFEAIRKGE